MVKHIELSKGMVALVDDEDFDRVAQLSWYAHKDRSMYYAVRDQTGERSAQIRMHRFILGAKPGDIIDHINGNGLDNRRCNLRLCSVKENARNRFNAQRSLTGFRGVTKCANGRFQARIGHNFRRLSVGYFDTAEEAARARDRAAIELHGEFAFLNFPSEYQPAERS